ncbi:cytochrome P450 2A5-like [Castor canadensis]|uniref:Cytochrome P450 n=1 Tax=Castor canadensis TaxID=51338 RepID=A0A8B7TQB7_CASCN
MALGLLLLAVVAFLSVMVLKSVWYQKKLSGKLPPGPAPLPFIGNYLQLKTEFYTSIIKISKTYGPVFTIYLGPRRFVVLCGYKALKEALVDQAEEFSGRGRLAIFHNLIKGIGLGHNNEDHAKQLRRFCITTLRDFGMGKRSIEERIQEEASFLKETLQDTRGAYIDPTFYLSKAVCNIISSIVFGDRFDYEDEEFLSLLKRMLGLMQFMSSSAGQLYEMFYSVMNHLPGPQQQAIKKLLELEAFIIKKVEQNQETLDPNSPRNVIDSFLIRMQEEKNNPNTEFYVKNLVIITLTLFFAGTETVSTNLRYCFQLLMKYPDVAAKVHEEIDRVIGRDRQPKFEDHIKMPYTEAVIHESLRYGGMSAMGLARMVTKDTRFRGFFIPKDTEVLTMLGTLMTDSKFFPGPENFDPHHFLDEKGKFKKIEAFMPFSMGKRSCLGEGLARMELFLFVTTIMQHFQFKSAQMPQDMEVSRMQTGITTLPLKYTMSFLPR